MNQSTVPAACHIDFQNQQMGGVKSLYEEILYRQSDFKS